MIEESKRLVDCPFCRLRPALAADPQIHVECDCGAQLWGGKYFHFQTFEQAIEAWNRNAWGGVAAEATGLHCPVLRSDEVLVALTRGEGYEDVVPELLASDALDRHGSQFAWRVVSEHRPTASEAREGHIATLLFQADRLLSAAGPSDLARCLTALRAAALPLRNSDSSATH